MNSQPHSLPASRRKRLRSTSSSEPESSLKAGTLGGSPPWAFSISARAKGTQIIQLFGRGVRLKGKDHKLKRSSALEDSAPQFVPLLETLNIFGIEANYLEQFREYLIEEGIEVDTYIDIPLSIRINDDYFNEGLLIPHIDKRLFKREDSSSSLSMTASSPMWTSWQKSMSKTA